MLLPAVAVMREANGLVVNMFEQASVNAGDIRLSLKTDYPASGLP